MCRRDWLTFGKRRFLRAWEYKWSAEQVQPFGEIGSAVRSVELLADRAKWSAVNERLGFAAALVTGMVWCPEVG
jgi:hypothetical protein